MHLKTGFQNGSLSELTDFPNWLLAKIIIIFSVTKFYGENDEKIIGGIYVD